MIKIAKLILFMHHSNASDVAIVNSFNQKMNVKFPCTHQQRLYLIEWAMNAIREHNSMFGKDAS